MDIFKKFATDPKKESVGVRHQLDDTTVIVIARYGNEEATALLRQLQEKHALPLASTDRKLVEKTHRDNLIAVMAEHVLVDWEGIEFQGKKFDYSITNAKTLLGLNDFFDVVWTLSHNADNYRFDEVAKTEKN